MLTAHHRIVVVGTSGAGKTTFARELARRLGFRHIELDALHWGPSWTPRADFRERVREATAGERWVADGNYGAVRDELWGRAHALIWLNYSFPVVFGRALVRTARRLVSQEELFGGNRETLARALAKDGIPWWVIRTYRRRRRELPLLLADPRYRHLAVVELRRPADASALLAQVSLTSGDRADRTMPG